MAVVAVCLLPWQPLPGWAVQTAPPQQAGPREEEVEGLWSRPGHQHQHVKADV